MLRAHQSHFCLRVFAEDGGFQSDVSDIQTETEQICQAERHHALLGTCHVMTILYALSAFYLRYEKAPLMTLLLQTGNNVYNVTKHAIKYWTSLLSTANRRACIGCIGMYWDVLLMF